MDSKSRSDRKLTALRYVVRAKERGVWQKEREHLLAEQKEVEAEMAAFVAKHEGEINELLEEYWTMRKQAGEWLRLQGFPLSFQSHPEPSPQAMFALPPTLCLSLPHLVPLRTLTAHRGLHEHDDREAGLTDQGLIPVMLVLW